MSLSSVGSPSPSSLESRPPSPAADTQLSEEGSGLAAGILAVAEGAALESELLSPGTLGSEIMIIGEYKVRRENG